MSATIYDTREVTVAPKGGPISILVELTDLTTGEIVMSFTSDCRWKYFPGADDPDRTRDADWDSLDDFEALIRLGARAADYDISRVDITVASGTAANKKHKYKVKFTVRQDGDPVDVWSTEERKFEVVDVFALGYVFLH